MQPGSAESYIMVVLDVKETHKELIKRGVEVSEIDLGVHLFIFSDPDENTMVNEEDGKLRNMM